ncbi:MAG: glycoside hydrolase family 3 C-terminal domain-containing protein, partial [Cellulosilyticaceae bacterium]
RNFEYFSEDPYLSGAYGIAWVSGVQSKGIGTSLKHYAVNNQEKARLISNSVVDKRALHEIYLSAFETTIKQAKPWTVMCSYNRINGEYGCQNTYTLDTCLRKEWGFDGIVVTDWGAMDDRVQSLKAGLELEMPGLAEYNDAAIVEAVRSGELDETVLDDSVIRMVEMILRAKQVETGVTYDAQVHHELARRMAAECMVLLKNKEEVLPLKQGASYAVIGGFAKEPRYQGAGSSKINPHKIDGPLEELEKAGFICEYAQGYPTGDKPADETLIAEACACAKDKESVIIFAGLPDAYEGEGYDRRHLNMPESHNALIEAVAKVNNNVTVVLMCGSAVVMPWEKDVKGILLAYLGGEAVGGACCDVLTGKVNPSGKLAETFPLKLEDTPAYLHFAKDEIDVEYRESIFVGYRFYDWADKDVQYPFGYGLSYTSFAYSDLKVEWEDATQTGKVTAVVTNTGNVKGKEVIQLYIGLETSQVMRAPKELKGFTKVELEAGESQTVEFRLDERSFAFYDATQQKWCIEQGEYTLFVGNSSRDLPLQIQIPVQGEQVVPTHKYEKEKVLKNGIMDVDYTNFEQLFDGPVPHMPEETGVTMNTRLGDILKTEAGAAALDGLIKRMRGAFEVEDEAAKMMSGILFDMPIRGIGMLSGGALDKGMMAKLIDQINSKI